MTFQQTASAQYSAAPLRNSYAGIFLANAQQNPNPIFIIKRLVTIEG